MVKECAKRKFIITGLTLLIFLFTMLCPQVESNQANIHISYQNGTLTPVYLLDSASYVARTNLMLKETQLTSQVKEILSVLTIDSPSSIYIPTLFTPVIPKNTKILGIDIQDKIAKINFDSTFLSVSSTSASKMIECIVYSLTEFAEIDGVLLYVDGTLLEEIPHTQEKLSLPLTRAMGVNKVYSLQKISGAVSTTTYYIAKEEGVTYYVPVTLISNDEKEKIEIVIDRLKTRPNLQANLMSYLHANTELTHFELLEQEVILSFNPFLYEGLSNTEMIEEVKYSIALSVKDSFQVSKVTIQ